MPLILHPDGGKLLRTATGLAGSTDCCCGITDCESFENCFGTPVSGFYPNWDGTVTIAGVTDDNCDDCEAVNTTYDAVTPSVVDQPVITEECSIGWGSNIIGGVALEFCGAVPATASGNILIWYDGTDWNVYASIDFVYDFEGPQQGGCSLTLTGQDALDVVNDLCSGGSVALIMDSESWTSFELCNCIGATLTATLTAV